MAVYDVNRLKYNRPNIARISEDARNVFTIKIGKGEASGNLASNDWMDILVIPPHYEVQRFSIRNRGATSAGAYKLIIPDARPLNDKADDDSARDTHKTLGTWAAAGLVKDKWYHYAATDSSAGANVVLGGQDWWRSATESAKQGVISLQATTAANGDTGKEIDLVVDYFDTQSNYRLD